MTALTQRVFSEIEAAPEPVQSEVLDLVLFVKARAGATPGSGASGRIHRTPGVCGGEACVGMTRVAVFRHQTSRGRRALAAYSNTQNVEMRDLT